MGPACRKVQEKLPRGTEALFCRTGTNFSFTLIYVYGIGVRCQSFGTRVASLFPTGAGGRNIPSNSKKAYQSFEAQHWQDVLHSHLFCWSFFWSYTTESDFRSQYIKYISYLQAKDRYSRRQERESGRVEEAFWSMALNDVFGFVASISFSSRRWLSLGNREPMSPSCSSGLEHAYLKKLHVLDVNLHCWILMNMKLRKKDKCYTTLTA